MHLEQLVQAERLKHTARLPYLQLSVHSELWSESALPGMLWLAVAVYQLCLCSCQRAVQANS
jgi:hypothetical protein